MGCVVVFVALYRSAILAELCSGCSTPVGLFAHSACTAAPRRLRPVPLLCLLALDVALIALGMAAFAARTTG